MSKVFIGLPVYNGANFLEAALQSLANQTYRDFQVLIADNASTDETEDICHHFVAKDSRFIYHCHPENLGAAPNFNFCVEQASGTYFKWMAHDDLCEPEYLEKCINVLERDDAVVLAQARAKCVNDEGTVTGHYAKEWDFNDSDPIKRFARAMALDHACVTVFGLIRLEILKKTPAISPFVGSDRSLLAELALHGSLEYVPEELFLWRDHKSRSVKIANRRQRLAWFNPKAKTVFSSLYSQQIWANQKAVMRATLPMKDKIRATANTVKWVTKNHKMLLSDLRTLGGAIIRYRSP